MERETENALTIRGEKFELVQNETDKGDCSLCELAGMCHEVRDDVDDPDCCMCSLLFDDDADHGYFKKKED